MSPRVAACLRSLALRRPCAPCRIARKAAGAHRPDSSLSSEWRKPARADALRLADARSPIPAQSFVCARSTTGASRCSNATGSSAGDVDVEGPCVGAAPAAPSLPEFCSAASIQMASSIHAGVGAEGRRRTVANLASTWPIDNRRAASRRSKQRPVPAGDDAAPRGQPPRRQIGIAFLPRQGYELVGEQFVDGGGANDQAIKKPSMPFFWLPRTRASVRPVGIRMPVHQVFIPRSTRHLPVGITGPVTVQRPSRA